MYKMMAYFLFLVSMLPAASALGANASDAGHVVAGRTFEWHWERGAFKGAAFRVSFLPDGRVQWRGTEGGASGKQDTEKQYQSLALSKDLQMISWLEKSGYTVTIILDSSDGTCQGIVSNNSEWYPLSGKFKQVN